MNKLFRCTFFFLEEKFKYTPASNVFLRAPTQEEATEVSRKIFEGALKERGISKAIFHQEVLMSSEEEVENYRSQMNKSNVSRMVN